MSWDGNPCELLVELTGLALMDRGFVSSLHCFTWQLLNCELVEL